MNPEPRITVIGKAGCHLCDDALDVVAQVAAETGVTWQELSIADDIELEMRYWQDIPVILVDGRPHARWRVDAAALREALRTPEVTT